MFTVLMMRCAPSPAIACPALVPAVWDQTAGRGRRLPCRYRHHHCRRQPSGVIGDVMEGISVGTRFHAQESPLENRKRWILARRRQVKSPWMKGRPRDSGTRQFITSKRN
jgi:hypothetical protein